ncbi:MAG TPA: hypothetical protein VJ754_07000 [Anaerolineae bacterium]|nr:hypothetical protein [Anaerolineae bacterium]
MQTDFDKDLLTYFTDVEYLRDAFKQKVAAPTLTKRLLVIHGVGGVGKSSLLRMFRLHCKGARADCRQSLAEVAPLLAGEFLIGAVYVLLGYTLFRWFEYQAKRRGTLETV